MTVIELKEFIFGNYYKRIRFSKENSYYSLKHQKKKKISHCLQLNQQKKYMILVMLKNTVNHL